MDKKGFKLGEKDLLDDTLIVIKGALTRYWFWNGKKLYDLRNGFLLGTIKEKQNFIFSDDTVKYYDMKSAESVIEFFAKNWKQPVFLKIFVNLLFSVFSDKKDGYDQFK